MNIDENLEEDCLTGRLLRGAFTLLTTVISRGMLIRCLLILIALESGIDATF